MPVYLYRLKTYNPYLNLATEEFIFSELEKNKEDVYLLFYENLPSIILGKNLEYNKEVFGHKKHPPVLRRSSGGGSVVHFGGNINFGLIVNSEHYPHFRMIGDSYTEILGTVAKVLSGNIKVEPGGISDLCMVTSRGKKKISGNSQARKRNWVLHHGTILYNTRNLSLIPYFLRHPPKEPDYRKGKTHRDFMIKHLPSKSPSEIIKEVSRAFAELFKTDIRQQKPEKIFKQVIQYSSSIALPRLFVPRS